MSSKHPKKDISEEVMNQLGNSYTVDPIYSLAQLSALKSQNRTQGPPLSQAYLQQSTNNRTNLSSNRHPPPVPPRTNSSSLADRYRHPGMNGYPGMSSYTGMNNYSRVNSMYNPYSPRYTPGLYTSGLYSSPYSSYRMPYSGHFGAPNDAYGSFLQMAEESTRPAFQSIESVVQVVNSISMMLESTYGAVHSSYSAILGVVDQFSRLKDHLAEVFSLLALVRGLHWLCLKVLYLLKLRKNNPSVEAAWNKAKKTASSSGYSESNGSAWPFFMFLSIVIGAPWLMFKLLSRNVTKKPFDPNMWLMPNGERMLAYGAYDFNSSQPGELSFRAGEKIYLSPKDLQIVDRPDKHWLYACNEHEQTGLVPVNYLLIPGSNTKNSKSGNIINSPRTTKILANYPVPGIKVQRFPKTSPDDSAFSEEPAFSNEDLPVPKNVSFDVQPSAKKGMSAPILDNLEENIILHKDLDIVTDSEKCDKTDKTSD